MLTGVEDGGTLLAEYGGWSTVSRLTLTPGVEDHGQIYACRATNMLLDEAVSDAVTLNVVCTSALFFSLSFPPPLVLYDLIMMGLLECDSGKGGTVKKQG